MLARIVSDQGLVEAVAVVLAEHVEGHFTGFGAGVGDNVGGGIVATKVNSGKLEMNTNFVRGQIRDSVKKMVNDGRRYADSPPSIPVYLTVP